MRERLITYALLIFFTAAFAFPIGACAGAHKAPVYVAQAGIATVDSVEEISKAIEGLTDAGTIQPALALKPQQTLLAISERLKPLPDILRTIDDLQKAGDSTLEPVERAIALLTVASQDISITIAGVPFSEATAKLIDLVRESDKAITGILLELAKLKERES